MATKEKLALRIGQLDEPWLIEVKPTLPAPDNSLKEGEVSGTVQIGRDAIIIGPNASFRVIVKALWERLRGRGRFGA